MQAIYIANFTSYKAACKSYVHKLKVSATTVGNFHFVSHMHGLLAPCQEGRDIGKERKLRMHELEI